MQQQKKKSKETETKSKKAQKRNLVYDLTFSSSSDKCASSRESKVSECIPHTQTTSRQLTSLRLSLSQEESILNANRRGRKSLSLKSQKKTEDLLEEKSGDEVSEISDSIEEHLLRCDMGENSKTSSVEGEAKQDVMEDDWDGNEFTKSQIEVLENLESSELNKSAATSTLSRLSLYQMMTLYLWGISLVVPMKGLELLKKPSNRSILVLKL